MGLTVVVLLMSFSLRSTAGSCFNYDLDIEEIFDLDVDVTDQCSSGDCIVLSSDKPLASNQSYDCWCYKKKNEAFYVPLKCCNVTETSKLNKKQVKFKCYYKSFEADCSSRSLSSTCIQDWMEACKANDINMGCDAASVTTPTTTFTPESTVSSSTEDITDSSSTTENESETTDESTTLATAGTNPPSVCVPGSCLPGECFFQDHCYFITHLFQPGEKK